MPDKQFSENMANRFDGFGSAPSDAVWTGIESQLVKDERKRRFIIWWFTGVLALGVISTVLIFADGSEIVTKTPLAETSTNTESFEGSNTHSNKQDSSSETLNSKNPTETSTTRFQNTENLPARSSEASAVKSSLESFHTSRNGNTTDHSNTSDQNKKENKNSRNANRFADISMVDSTDNHNSESDLEADSDSHSAIDRLNLLTLSANNLMTPERESAYFMEGPNVDNKWLLGFRFSQFVTVSPRIETNPVPVPPTQSDPNSLADLSTQNYIEYNNDRTFEAELFIQRQFNNRLNIASGITGSFMKRAYTVYTDGASSLTPSPSTSSANKLYWNVGIPIRIDYYLIHRKRFQFGGGISFLTEYGFVKNYSTMGTTDSFNGLENIALVTESKERAIQLSVQPYFRANYRTLNRWNFFLEAGYRKNILDASESSKYILPGYVTFTGGLTWEL